MDDKGLDGRSVFEKTINNDREFQTLKLDHSLLQDFANRLKNQLQEAEEALQKSRHDYFEVVQNRDLINSDLNAKIGENDSLRIHKMELVQLIDRKNDEISRLKNNIDSNGLGSLDSSLNSSLNDIKLKEIQFNFEEKRFNHERNLYKNQINLLNDDLKAKSEELLNLRKETSMSLMQANVKMNQQSNEINSLHLEINGLKAINENKEKNNSELAKKHLDLQLECTKLESIKNKETDAQNDIINLLMKRIEELQNELSNKDNDISDLRNIIQKGHEAHNDLEASFTTMKDSFVSDLKQLEMEKDKYAEELEHAKLRFSEFNKHCIEKEFERYFPVAYQNNQQLNMLSMSDLYQMMIEVKKENSDLVGKNAQLENTIDTLEYKLNEEKPILYKNLQDYDLLVSKYSLLENNVMTLMKEKEKFISEKDDDIRDINTLKREINRYECENEQLSLQIQYLLQNVHEANGFNVREESTVAPSEQFNIPLNLITFKNIQDLQEKNRELLQFMHRLSEELDSPSAKDDKLVNLKNENDEYKRENDFLMSELNQKIELLNSQLELSATDDAFDLNKELAKENIELKDKIEKFQKDVDSNRQQNIDDIRRLEKEKNSLIGENSSFKLEVSKLSSELESKSHYLEDISMQLDQYQNENSSLRERNIKLNANVENLEKNVINVKNEIDSLKEAIKLSEKNLHLAQCERDLFRNSEINLAKENSLIKQELENQTKLVYSLKAAQDNLTRSESESIRNLQTQLDNLQKNNQYYREKADKQEDKWKNSVNDFSVRINNLQILLDKEKSSNIEFQHKYFELQTKLQQQIDKGVSAVASELLPGHSGVISSDHKKQLINLQDEIKVLKGKLINSESTCENLKAINTSLEENLTKLINNNEEIKSNIDTELLTKQMMIQKLQENLDASCQQYEEIVAQKNNSIQHTNEQINLLNSQMEELKNELTLSKEATLRAEENAQKLIEDLKYQTVIANKALEDFEAEATLRSGDATTIFEFELKIKDLQKTILEMESELNKLKEEANLNVNLWNTQRKSLLDGSETLKLRCSSLESTNESLLSQIDQLNNQVIALQNNSNLFALDENIQKENSTQLLSVVKFLREEKSQLQSKLAKISDDHMCLTIEIENYKREVENLRNSLEIEKQSTNRLTNISEFNDLMSKAEIVPVLTETNSQMRIKINQLEKRCNELVEKITRYESNERMVDDLSNKAEEDVVEKQFLRNEVEQWKNKAKNCDVDSLRRLSNEKTNLGKQLQLLYVERNKLKQDLDKAINQMRIETEEKAKFAAEKENLKIQNTQLRNVAKKYKEKAEKAESDKSGVTTNTSDKEVQCETSDLFSRGDSNQQENRQLLEELHAKLGQKEEEIKRLSDEIDGFEQDNDSLRKTATEKESKAKEIAEKAKARIGEISNEKKTLLRERENLIKENEEYKTKIANLQMDVEQKLEHINLIKSQYDSKDKELQLANKHIENLNLHLQQPQPPASTSPSTLTTSPQLTVTVPSTSSGSSSTNFSLLSQQQSPVIAQAMSIHTIKTTPTASIKPLTVAASRSSRTANLGHRPVTMVQPTANTDEQVTMVNLPHATVQPTQPLSIPSSIAVSSTISFTSPIEISEASTSQNLVQSTGTPFSVAPSTSGLTTNTTEKRSYDPSDEPTSSQSKKIKTVNYTETSTARTDENSRDDEIDMEQSADNEGERNVSDENVLEIEENAPNQENSSSTTESNHVNEHFVDEEESSDVDEEEIYNEADFSEQRSGDEVDSHDEDEEEAEEEEDEDFEEENVEDFDDGEDDIEDIDEDEDEEAEESDDQNDDDSEIEVIAIDDSDDDEQNSNPIVRDEVSSSHASTSRTTSHISQTNQSLASNDLTTTTNDDGTYAQNVQSQMSADAAQIIAPDSEEDKQAVSSQSSNRFATNEEGQVNTSEIASSTSTGNFSSNANTRRPITWSQNSNLNSPNSGSRPNVQQGQTNANRRQLHVRGNRMALRRGNNPRNHRRGGNYY